MKLIFNMKLMILIILFSLFPFFTAYAQEYDRVWVSIDDRYRLISINYFDDPAMCESGKACTTTSSIIFIKGYEFHPTRLGCNAWTHEVLHFWGYSHEDMEKYFWCEITDQ